MKAPLPYLCVVETDNVTTLRNIIFKPKGSCLYRALLEYSFGQVVERYTFENDHRLPVRKFGKWVQGKQIEIEERFLRRVEAMRLDALLSEDSNRYARLMATKVEGRFNAWVIK